jgi:hypothetical protein
MIKHENRLKLYLAPLLLLTYTVSLVADSTHYAERTEYFAPKALIPPVIDGVANEAIWQKAEWADLTHRWLGPEYTAEDFSAIGRNVGLTLMNQVFGQEV